MKHFGDFGLSQELQETIMGLGFSSPTQIQEESIPYILKGKDVVGESATGSGKTLAFGCGIIEKINPGKGLQSLILTPTRELAEQVKKELFKFSGRKKLKIISIYGGVSINPQIRDLRSANIVVATPGRLLDHVKRRTINLSNIDFLVLDEADRMFDMGFIDDVDKIISLCPKKRQTLFFSATISSGVKKLSKKHMNWPIEVYAKKMVDPKKLKQVYYNIPKNIKLSLLLHLFENEKSGLSMIFCNTRRTVDLITKNLKLNNFDAVSIHGGLNQNKRTKTIELFNKGKSSILVCTDVAARGLDITNVSHVYNYEIPKDPNDYIHRIGRTARAGEEGKVINLLSEQDYNNFSRISNEYRSFFIERMNNPYVKKVNLVGDKSNSFKKRNFSRKNNSFKKRRSSGFNGRRYNIL